MMRWAMFDPPRDEIAAVAGDLIARFGQQARDEALHLEEVAETLGSKKNRRMYRLAAREIETRFTAAHLAGNPQHASASL